MYTLPVHVQRLHPHSQRKLIIYLESWRDDDKDRDKAMDDLWTLDILGHVDGRL